MSWFVALVGCIAFVAAGSKVMPEWEKATSCVIKITEEKKDLGKIEREYCCEGWKSMINGNLIRCSKYVGTDNTSDLFITNNHFNHLEKDVQDIRSTMNILNKTLTKGAIDILNQQLIQYAREAEDLEKLLERTDSRISEMEVKLNITRQPSYTDSNPCTGKVCTDHPDATCYVISLCGKDRAVFMNDFYELVRCSSEEPCPYSCEHDPCEGLSCPSTPNAICFSTKCCDTYWIDEEGLTIDCPDVDHTSR